MRLTLISRNGNELLISSIRLLGCPAALVGTVRARGDPHTLGSGGRRAVPATGLAPVPRLDRHRAAEGAALQDGPEQLSWPLSRTRSSWVLNPATWRGWGGEAPH